MRKLKGRKATPMEDLSPALSLINLEPIFQQDIYAPKPRAKGNSICVDHLARDVWHPLYQQHNKLVLVSFGGFLIYRMPTSLLT